MNNMNAVEYRVKREERRLAKYELKKLRLELRRDEEDDTTQCRIIVWAIAAVLITLTVSLSVMSIAKTPFEKKQITECERALTAAHMIGNCDTPKVGSTKG